MAHLPAPIARSRGALREFLLRRRRSGELTDDDLLLVACSGGADSVALAATAAFLAPRMGLRAGLVTVDHGLQAGSDTRATEVTRLAEQLGLDPALSLTAPGSNLAGSDTPELPATGLGPEGHARELRYAALERALESTGARAVLLGHTMEDQAETVLLGLSRGAGTRAVAGMPEVREQFWRPFLRVRRADTEAACAQYDLPVWHDPTNQPDGPWRTSTGEPLPRAALRHHAIPQLASALGQDPVPALARTAYLARVDSDFIEALAREQYHLLEQDGIAVNDLVELPAALRWRVLRELALRAGAPPSQMTMGHVHQMDALITDWRGQQGISLPRGLRAHRSCGRLYVVDPQNLENA